MATALWAHAALGHGTAGVLARALRCLEDPLLHPSPGDTVLIAYALAKLGMRGVGFQRRAAAALLGELPPCAEGEAEEEERAEGGEGSGGPHGQQQEQEQQAWWQLGAAAEQQHQQQAEAAAAVGMAAGVLELAGGSASSEEEDEADAGCGPVLLHAGGQALHPASAYTLRELCLLAWSLAEGGAASRELLRRLGSEAARRGVGELSVQSMCQLLGALERAGVAHGTLMDAVAAEVARRYPPPPRQQQRQQQRGATPKAQPQEQPRQAWARQPAPPPQPQGQQPPLNEQDLANLLHAAAFTWQRQLTAAAGAAEPGDRVAWPPAVRAHLAARPQRRALHALLMARVGAAAPRLGLRALCGVSWGVAVLGGVGAPPGLLDAMAARACELEGRLDPHAVAGLAWAYAALAHDSPPLFASLATAATRLLSQADTAARFTPQVCGWVCGFVCVWGGWGGGEAGGRGSGRSGVTCNCRGATA